MTKEEAYVGQLVRPSAHGLRLHRTWTEEVRATIKGFSKQHPDCLRVLRVGCKTTETYAPHFWEPVTEANQTHQV